MTFIEKIKSSVFLKDNEKVCWVDSGLYCYPEKVMKGDYQAFTMGGHRGRTYREEKEGEKFDTGAILLTSQRFIWLKKKGLLNATYYPVFEIPLNDVVGRSVVGHFGKRIVFSDRQREYKFKTEGDIEAFLKVFDDCCAAARGLASAEKARERVQIVLDFSSLKDVLSKGGVVMQTFNCPKCNGVLDIPETGKLLFCRYCGTPVKPIDVYEKIRSFIEASQ